MSYYGQQRARRESMHHPVRNGIFVLIVGLLLLRFFVPVLWFEGSSGAKIGAMLVGLYGFYCVACAIKQFITKRTVNGVADFFSSSWRPQ